MKTYSAIINVIDDSRIDILYECDNKKNTKCDGHNNCRDCEYTYELRYAKDISTEKTRLELKKELEEKDKEIEDYKQMIRELLEGKNIYNKITPNQLRKIYNLKPIESMIIYKK